MNCDRVRQHWDLFHDSEGDAELHHEINEHLAMCPACAGWYRQQSRLEEALAERLQARGPSAELWARIRSACTGPHPARPTGRVWSRPLLWVACGMVALCIGLFVNRLIDRPPPAEPEGLDLARLSVRLHENLASGREPLKLYSRSPHEVETFVRTLVRFRVRCPPRADAGFQVVGGGVCHFEKDPVAYVVGHVEGCWVSVFILACESLAHYPAAARGLGRSDDLYQQLGSWGVAMGRVDRNLVLVVGPPDRDRLTRVLKAYGTYPQHDAGGRAEPIEDAA